MDCVKRVNVYTLRKIEKHTICFWSPYRNVTRLCKFRATRMLTKHSPIISKYVQKFASLTSRKCYVFKDAKPYMKRIVIS